MIRVIILLVFLFLVWVLYASNFEKPRKIRICIIAVVLCAIGFWFDGYDKRQLRDLVDLSDIENCGVSGEYSYRTNFDFSICLKNNADKGTLSRLKLAVIASECEAGSCNELQRVERSLLVNISPSASVTLEQNLNFDKISPSQAGLAWSVDILETKAHR